MEIRIKVDPEQRQFIITDGGIGMTKEDMVNMLGSLGSSGTKKFQESMANQTDTNLIGQFGIGFYSAFLIGSRAKVASKHDDSEKQWVWESTGDGKYYIYEDTRGNTLGRGTEVTLEVKKDADEYLSADKITDIVKRYSGYIHYPIKLHTTRKEFDEKAEDDAEDDEKKKQNTTEDAEKNEGSEDDELIPEKEVVEWITLNNVVPLWTRSPDNITETEYNSFFKSISKQTEDPLYYAHFAAEGEVQFKSLLYLTPAVDGNLDYTKARSSIKLFVRRIFVTDQFKDMLPGYLGFVNGLVDSDDLPLNVSRELLQESRVLKIIKKKLVRKTLSMLDDIAKKDKSLEKNKKDKKNETKDKTEGDTKKDVEDAETKEKQEEEENEDIVKWKPGTKKQTAPLYEKIWKQYGHMLKYGTIHDGTNRLRTAKLLRYTSTKSNFTSFQDYVDGMKEGQKGIYFIAGESVDKIKQTTICDDAVRRGYEVLLMDSPMDEWVVQSIPTFAGKKFYNLATSDAKFETKTAREKEIHKKRTEKYKPLTKRVKDILGKRVSNVILTERTSIDPFVIVSTNSVSTNMRRVMKGMQGGKGPEVKAQLEVNYLHPLVDEIFNRIKSDETDKVAEEFILTMFDVASIQGGFDIDPVLHARRMTRIMSRTVDLTVDDLMLKEDTTEFEAAIDEEAAAKESKEDKNPKKEGDSEEKKKGDEDGEASDEM